ncbi:alpha/beta hydrolase [Streptomyces canus]|uniref:alpha/beta hydrolase n=1 Tax=Streptomyces canus TaxID=58343 RepID=UPI002E2A55FC|nr:alpha/beta hydrolase [Streptomyces canus]
MNESEALAIAVARVWPSVPELLGPTELHAFESEVLAALRTLEATADADLATPRYDLAALFESKPTLQRLLSEEFDALDPGWESSGSKRSLPGAIAYLRSLIVTVLFATDRAYTVGATDEPVFGGSRGELSYGKTLVGIPDDHRMGSLEKPRLFRLRFRASPAKDVLVGSTSLSDPGSFADEARSLLAGLTSKQAIIFVHGYNVGFADASVRAAQIAYDLNFSGLLMVYSWPSRSAVLSYPEDENNARWTVSHFQDFLRLVLTGSGVEVAHVVAHSMGGRVVTEALAQFDTTALPEGSGRLGEVVFAAPDVDSAVFRQLAPAIARQARGCTLYASSKDRALKVSRRLAGYARAGQSGDGIVVVDGVHTIDATGLDTGLMSHSYVGEHSSILSDIYTLLAHGHPPSERFGLEAVRGPHGNYWAFQPDRRR